jgi:hypothetical protein
MAWVGSGRFHLNSFPRSYWGVLPRASYPRHSNAPERTTHLEAPV